MVSGNILYANYKCVLTRVINPLEWTSLTN